MHRFYPYQSTLLRAFLILPLLLSMFTFVPGAAAREQWFVSSVRVGSMTASSESQMPSVSAVRSADIEGPQARFGFSGALTAVASGSVVALSSHATLISSSQVDVQVSIVCEGGTGFVSVQMQEPRTPLPPATGFGSIQVVCDGHRQKYIVPVFGFNFNLGNALASATLTAPSGTDTDTGNVRIAAP
jgi:hypothetical protein